MRYLPATGESTMSVYRQTYICTITVDLYVMYCDNVVEQIAWERKDVLRAY